MTLAPRRVAHHAAAHDHVAGAGELGRLDAHEHRRACRTRRDDEQRDRCAERQERGLRERAECAGAAIAERDPLTVADASGASKHGPCEWSRD